MKRLHAAFTVGSLLSGVIVGLSIAWINPLLAAPGDTLGDCFKMQGGQRVAVAFVASPNNPVDCGLPANTCEPIDSCQILGGGWVRWKTAIKIGDCSKPNVKGTCQECPEYLHCAKGDYYLTANDCANETNKQVNQPVRMDIGPDLCK